MTKWNSASVNVPDTEVRQKAQIWINNLGIKSSPLLAEHALLWKGADFMFDCRGIPDAVTGLNGYKSLEEFVEKQIDLGPYIHIILQAIHAIPKRRYQMGPNWAKDPIKITCFCAHGMHRSRAMRNLIARELKALGYNVIVNPSNMENKPT